MKTKNKPIVELPEVHVLGDLTDVKNLVEAVNRKRSLVIFREGDDGACFLEVEGEFHEIVKEDIPLLETNHRIIYFSFYPDRRKLVRAAAPQETPEPEPTPAEEPTPAPEEKPDDKKKKHHKGRCKKCGKKGKCKHCRKAEKAKMHRK